LIATSSFPSRLVRTVSSPNKPAPAAWGLAEDQGLNVFYGGHYATETFGVKALSAALSKEFRVPWTFLDHPSGL
jgi:putative NIF3 family GTP cyclohydrolase 1 type 2